ncbi:recombinase family protein [Salegentibacter sp. LM13S]|uniref:recombinase family protein n=1 Tax=Salegentibacter lacus TaxID=2873599 RepID=UPI001CCCD844|nr:recombinase family protein [Salegentibacter lacus]MBZ9630539.1 recombinase family protein [Salegentibacter lacus]
METAIIVARCSTTEKKQDVTRQVKELQEKYSNLYEIVEVYSYYESGTKNSTDNTKILNLVKDKGIENIIVSEISRIARRVIKVLQFVEVCNENQVNIIIDNYNLHTLTKEKEVNQMVHMMLTMGASFAQMELDSTMKRMNSGRKKFVKEGGKLGRTEGTTESPQQFLSKHRDVVKHLKAGQSIRNAMKLTLKSSGTVQKVKKLMV